MVKQSNKICCVVFHSDLSKSGFWVCRYNGPLADANYKAIDGWIQWLQVWRIKFDPFDWYQSGLPLDFSLIHYQVWIQWLHVWIETWDQFDLDPLNFGVCHRKKQLPIHQWPLCSYDRHLTRIRKMCFNRMRICWRPFRPFSWDLAIGPSSGTSWRIPPLDLKHFKAATREHVRSFGILPLRVKMVKWSVCGIRNRRLIAHLNAIEPCSSDSILGTGPVPEACVECNIDKLKSAVEDGAIAEFSRIFLLGCWSR